MGFLYLIVWLVWVVALEYLYHKVFTVYYFSLGQGLQKELVGAFFLGIIMTGLTFYLWWLTAIIIVAVGIANMSKTGNKSHIIIAIVLAIVVAILGLTLRLSSGSEESASLYRQYTEVSVAKNI
ncbi:MAG: hypothetical protein IJR96_09560 [Pseudobutyrivibrio sp.]|nr:hypothetical protein [Pseudobutyrivibrio sp.]